MYRLKQVLPPSLLVSANLFVFGTFAVYRGNLEEFEVGYWSLLPLFGLCGLLLTTAFLLVGFMIPSRAVEGLACAIFCLGLLLWVQGSFLVGTYGVFDGREIDWSQFGLRGWMDGLLWVLVLAAGLRFSRHLIRIASHASWTLMVLQAVSMLALSLTSEGGLWWKKYTLQHQVPTELLGYSSSKNIVHIILDSFQTDIFRELVAEQQLEDELEGFVLFEENMGVAPYTSFSIPAIFSGQIYDGKQPPGSYYRESVRKGFQNRLYDDGYRVNLVPLESMRESRYTNYYDVPRVYKGSPEDVVHLSAAHLMDVALFRQLPHWARQGIYNDNNWLITPLVAGHRNVSSFQKKAFFNHYAGNVFVGDPQPAYHFLHLIPPHPPYVTLADGSYAGRVLPTTRENYLNEARAILKLFLKLLNRLKELNLYDSSLIVLQGDHGSQIAPVIDGKTIEPCVPRLAALLTMKLPGGSGALTVSRAQTSLLDIPATIMKASGVDGRFPGRPLFEISPSEARSRPFVTYRTSRGEPELTKHLIAGSVFDPASCLDGEPAALSRSRPQYEFGADITFGLLGNADDFMGFGWSSPMSNGCWNNGHRASVKIRLAAPETDLLLKAALRPYIRTEVPEQKIHVLANGTEIDLWSAGRQQMHQFRAVIPKALIDSPEVEIGFHLPNAVSPRSIGAGGDERKLAIWMRSLSLHPWPGYRYGTDIQFGRNGNAEAFMGRGWSKTAEDGYCWTSGYLARLHIPAPVPENDLVLQAVLRPFLQEGRAPKQTIRVLANRNKVGDWTATESTTHTFQATIPKELVDSGGITIEFDLPDAVSPKSIGDGTDVRRLAAALVTVSLDEKDE